MKNYPDIRIYNDKRDERFGLLDNHIYSLDRTL